MFKKMLGACFYLFFCSLFVSCAKTPSKKVIVDEPDPVVGPSEIKTYSGTYALKAQFDAEASECGEKAVDLADIADTLNCEQSAEAFSCTSLLSNQVLKGSIVGNKVQIHNDAMEQDFAYIKNENLGLGKDVKTKQMLLEGSFVNLTTLTQGTLKYLEESSKDLFGGRSSCTLVWNASLIKSDDNASAMPPGKPEIKLSEDDNEEIATVIFEAKDEDSQDEDLEYRYFHFSGNEAAPYINEDKSIKMDDETIEALDWNDAQEPDSNNSFTFEITEDRVMHAIYVIAMDETENKSKASGISLEAFREQETGSDDQANFEAKPKELVLKEIARAYRSFKLRNDGQQWPDLPSDPNQYSHVTDRDSLEQHEEKNMLLECFDSEQCDVWTVKLSEELSKHYAVSYMKTGPQLKEPQYAYNTVIERLREMGKDVGEIKFIVETRENAWNGDLFPMCICDLYRVVFNNYDYVIIPTDEMD